MLLGPGPVAGPGDVAEAGRTFWLAGHRYWPFKAEFRRWVSPCDRWTCPAGCIYPADLWAIFTLLEPEKCMTQEKMHPHLFSERYANQHQHRTAEEKKMCVYVSGKQLIHWRCEESSTHHNSIDIKYMKHFRSALRLRQTFHLNTANHPCVITMNSALAWKLEGSNSTSALPLAA
ncbi:protein CASC2-like [Macaca thibetana thibetana]|uniref:protein CASC2-like n=1 Tax=Macaca thibetana thibetana TaxID=257877 RepID=UPI0021BCE0FF|nr:protein CASC2-like [Macaca thibetana thibetana]